MDQALRAIIDAHYDRCVSRVIYRLRRISSRDWQEDDAAERTLWDHWKRELQDEHSLMHGLIGDAVEAEITLVVEKLPHEVGALMTLVTDALDDLEEEPSKPIFAPDAVVAEVMNRLNSRAYDEPLRPEVQRRLDDRARDRFERDNEINEG